MTIDLEDEEEFNNFIIKIRTSKLQEENGGKGNDQEVKMEEE